MAQKSATLKLRINEHRAAIFGERREEAATAARLENEHVGMALGHYNQEALRADKDYEGTMQTMERWHQRRMRFWQWFRRNTEGRKVKKAREQRKRRA
ncbi:MAG: hypothetical protein JXB14_00235 [Candidatus Altiarchaeota archaeon]|nr:hypothetical protein [Candidatus Altiarchaeota archaeon]